MMGKKVQKARSVQKAQKAQNVAPQPEAVDVDVLLGDIRGLINAARVDVATAINSIMYGGTATSQNQKPQKLARSEPEVLHEEDRLNPDLVFRDPYFLELLGLKDCYSGKGLEDAVLREMERFLLELGNDFGLLAQQKHIRLDNDDYYIDLLFYHRGLSRLVAIDLKIGDFKAEYKGQMELCLRWLNRHERRPGEGEPLGIILCAGKKQELVELLELNGSGIRVAEYPTDEFPPKELLREKFHAAIELSRKLLDNRKEEPR